jgi:hypothetical protein
MRRSLKTFLRSPKVIIGEIVALALLCALGAALPQSGTSSPAELNRLHEQGWLVIGLVKALALDDVFHSVGFLAAALLTALSLFLLVVEQARRLRAQWLHRPTPADFRGGVCGRSGCIVPPRRISGEPSCGLSSSAPPD